MAAGTKSEVSEGKARIKVYSGNITKKDKVFYNPEMRFNRDVSVLALSIFSEIRRKQEDMGLRVCDVLSASGVRGIRYALEAGGIRSVSMNDLNPSAVRLMRANAKANKISGAVFSRKDANVLLSENKFSFDVIDIDPFGSPAPFFESSARAMSGHGFLGMTATDTGPLAGTYPKTCLRRYGAASLRCDAGHDIGLRILVGTVVRKFAEQDRDFRVMNAFTKIHYYRVHGISECGAGKADKSLESIGYAYFCRSCGNRGLISGREQAPKKCGHCEKSLFAAGPLWTGKTNDSEFCRKMLELAVKREHSNDVIRFLEKLSSEAGVSEFLPYDIHALCRMNRICVPRTEAVVAALRNAGFICEKSVMGGTMIRTDAGFEDVLKALKQ